MNATYRSLTFLLILSGTSISTANGQSPPPIIIQAATPAPAPVANPIAPTSESTTAVIKMLQELKTANEETLKKQQAVLEQLDELQKAAEQLKVFSKRG